MSEEKSPPTEEEPVAQTEETSKPEGNAKEKESSGGSGAVATIEKPKVFVLNETEEKLYESSDDEPYDGPVKYFKIEKHTSRLRPAISQDLLEKMQEAFVIPHDFSWPSDEKFEELAALDVWFRKHIVITIFEHLMIDRVREAEKYLDEHYAVISARYEKKEIKSLVEYAIGEDIPPLVLLRYYFTAKGLTKPKIRKALRGDESVVTDPDEMCEVKHALEVDQITTSGKHKQAESEDFQAKLRALLVELGIEFTEEEELFAQYQQQKRKVPVSLQDEDGNFVEIPSYLNTETIPKTKDKKFYLLPGEMELAYESLTPDFLFDKDPLFINNKEIRWIDAKKYVGGVSEKVTGDAYRQSKRYLQVIGGGAIVFEHGVVKGLNKKLPTQMPCFDFEHLKLAKKDV